MDRLIAGYRAFRAGRWPLERARYAELAHKGQNPDYLVISCSDSRADPATIFAAAPGELFVVRNVAGIVPPFEPDSGYHGTSAAVAFAVIRLGVKHVLVLGHAQCGGVAAAIDGSLAAGVPFLGNWIALMKPALEHSAHLHDSGARHTAMERDAVRLSLENLKTFPFVAERLRDGRLQLHGMRFGIADGALERLDTAADAFVAVT